MHADASDDCGTKESSVKLSGFTAMHLKHGYDEMNKRVSVLRCSGSRGQSRAGEFPGRSVNTTTGTGATERSWRLRDHKDFELFKGSGSDQRAVRERG